MTSTDAITESYGAEVARAMRGEPSFEGFPDQVKRIDANSFNLHPSVVAICEKAAAKRCLTLERWLGEVIWNALVEARQEGQP